MNYSLFRSATFWTLVLTFIIGGIQAISSAINPTLLTVIMALLTGAAAYFHLNTAVKAGAVN